MTLSSAPNTTLPAAQQQRVRKISRSSEDVRAASANPIDTVLLPFAKLTAGLQTLGTNLDTTLSRYFGLIVDKWMIQD